MRIGDAYSMTTVKATGVPRIVDATLKDETSLLAEHFVVEGDFRVADHPLNVSGRTMEILRANLHTPDNATPDSGIYAHEVTIELQEQLVVSGWIRGVSLVDISVPNSTGVDAILNFTSGPNSLKLDAGAVIQTTAHASRLSINASGSIFSAGTMQALGTASMLQATSSSMFRLTEGGVVRVTGDDSHLDVNGGRYLAIESGTAVTAGVDFITVDGSPVPTAVGANSRATLTAPGETWIAGSVSTTGVLTLAGGLKEFDHADYFDTLPGLSLLNVTPTPQIVTELQNGLFPIDLRQSFEAASIEIGGVVNLTILQSDRRWLATDEAGNRYVLYLADPNGDGEFDELQVMDPHPLIGQRGFGYLISGTITVLEPNRSVTLQSADDVLIRGNINLLGSNSDLVLQSDRWVYVEGVLQVDGDISISGGVSLDGTDRGGANANGTSVLIPGTSRLVTTGSGTSISIRGSRDIDVLGPVVAGGTIGGSGITWAGPDSSLRIQAGQQLYIDTGVHAAGTVLLEGGSDGANDHSLALVITTAGGTSAAGLTSTTAGSTLEIHSLGDMQILGTVVAGGTMVQQLNAQGERTGETFVWSEKPSTLIVNAADGQAWIGGLARNRAGDLVETGGYLWASQHIEIKGGMNSSGIGVKVSAASQIVAVNTDATVLVDSFGDADILGPIIAGGSVSRNYDANGQYLGRTAHYFDGESEIRIEADNQIRIGRDLHAGRRIDLVGGLDPIVAGEQYSGNGVVLYGSVQLSTWKPNSQINLNAPGPVTILAPAHTQELRADGFIATADGRLESDVELHLWLSRVDFDVTASVVIPAAATASNSSIQDLVADIQQALNATDWTVVRSDNSEYPLGSVYHFNAQNPDLTASVIDSRVALTGPFRHRLDTGSINASLLGWSELTQNQTSSLPWALLADQPGSVIRIGTPTGPNGKLYLGGKIKAYSSIELHSGVSDPSSPDAVYVELDSTGLLETVNGSITLSPGANTVLRGNVVAGGNESDVVITADETIELHGSLAAGRNILISAGTTASPGTESIRTFGTSSIRTIHGGEIHITGINDVVINSIVGTGSGNLTLIELASTTGNLLIAKESGRIETGTQINFIGHSVEIAGVVTSTRATPDLSDFEVSIDISGTASLHGDISLAGSLLVKATDIEVYDQSLVVRGVNQKLRFSALDDITFSRVVDSAGVRRQAGALISAPTLEISAGDTLSVNSGTILYSAEAGHAMAIHAANAIIVGTIYAGADLDSNRLPVWTAPGVAVLEISNDLTFGGVGLDENGLDVPRGGRIQAVNEIMLNVGGTISQSPTSALETDATAWGTRTASIPSSITLNAGVDLQLFGLVRAVDPGSDIALISGAQSIIAGLVTAVDNLSITAGSHNTGRSLIILPVIMGDDGETRISGGELSTGAGGHLTLTAANDIVIQGSVGGFSLEAAGISAKSSRLTANASAGDIIVEGRVMTSDDITLHADNISIAAGGVIRTTGTDSAMRLFARDYVLLEASVQTGTSVLNAGLLQASGFVHILGQFINHEGLLSGSSDRVLLTASDEVNITGQITSSGDVTIHAGVDTTLATEALETTTYEPHDLTGGSVFISDGGSIQSPASLRVVAGENFEVHTKASLSGSVTNRSRPIVTTVPQTVYVVTGYNQVATGTILVPEIRVVASTATRQVGTEEFKIGRVNYSMDVKLTQDGYYNPRAAANARIREYFVEGLDYYNSTNSPHGMTPGVPVINWASFGAQAPSSDYRSSDYRTYSQLSDVQRKAVLLTLGYMPLYDFSWAKALQNQTVDRVPTTTPWTPDWSSAPKVIEFIPIAGWNDKYIRMPKGAAADVLRVVSQGVPAITSEKVGSYIDRAVTTYTQDRSQAVDVWGNVNEPYPNPDEDLYKKLIADVDASPARWRIDYNSGGERLFSLSDGRSAASLTREPNWYWQSTTREEGVPDSPSGNASLIPGTSGTGRNVSVPAGYRSALASITSFTEFNTRTVKGSDRLDYQARRYTVAGFATDYGTQRSAAAAVGAILAEPRTAAQNSAIAGTVTVYGGYVGMYFNGGSWLYLSNNAPVRWLNFGTGQPSGDSEVVELGPSGYWNDLATSHSRDAVRQFEPKSVYQAVNETFRDYRSVWTSISTDVFDQRLTLQYQWTSNSHDLYGKRDRYETVPVNVTVASERSVTRWGTQPIREAQTSLVASRSSDSTPVASSEYAADALSAGSITLLAAGSATLNGRIIATSGALNIDAAGSVSADGTFASGSTADDAEAALALLQSATTIRVTAGTTILFGERSQLQTTLSEIPASGDVTLTAGLDTQLSGNLLASGSLSISTGQHLLLDGVINAAADITATAGIGTSATGSITASAFADLTAGPEIGHITLNAGSTAGNLTLTSATLTAGEAITLTAPAGSLSHGTGGYLEAPLVTATTQLGISGRTRAASVAAHASQSGDIRIDSLTDVRVEASTPDGGINVTALGNLHAASVHAGGSSPDSAVRLIAQPAGDMPSSLTIGQLTAVPAADLVLTAEGSITWETLPDATELVLQAASVTLTATTLPTLVVDTTLIRATVLEAGNLIINRTGTGDLTVHASVRNGSMSVTNPGGAIELADVQLHTNADTSDLVVTAAGDITIGRISTGQHYSSDADSPAGDADAAAGIHSLGDITLTSSGRISQNMADTAIDIIADRLTLEATLGIASLEIAVAELHAESTSGSISLTDLDSAGETVPGISSAILLAPAGSVTLHATGSIVIDQLTAGGNNGTAEVVSSGGDLRVLPGAASAPVTVQNKIDFRAAGTLRLPAFFTAPGTISYRAEQLIFNDATGSDGAGDGGGIPSVLQADTIVLEQRGGLTLKGISSITANRLELLTDGNLFATDIGSVNVTELVMLARGLKTVTAESYDGETGGTKQVQQPTGRINFQAVSVAAGIWDVRTSQEQFIELSQTGSTLLTVRGTLSGLVDSPRPQQLTFRASQPLRLQDAILAADTVTLSGTTISANAQTEIQATRISAEAAGSIRLYTASDVVSAVATGPGDVQITNTGTLTAELVSALNGTVALFATGNLTAVRVIQQTDGSGKDIQLTSDANIYVDYVDAGQAAGVNRAASKAILRAKGTIQEAPDRLDNAAPTDISQQSAFNIVDVVAWKTIFYHDQPMAEPKLIQSASDVGQGTELEIVYTAFSGLVSGAPPAVEMPRQVFGDYTLNITGYLDDIDLTVTGILTINQVTSNPGQLIRFSAGEGLVLNTPVDVGTGTVTLETDGDLILNAVITAAELVINASTVSQPLTLDVERLSFDLPAGGNLQVNNSGSLTLGSANAGGGSVNITAASSLQIDGTITQVQSLNLSAGTSISTSAGSSLTVTGNARFSGPSINLGSAQGDSLHLGSLTVVTSGTATVVEDGDMVLSGTSSAAGLNLTATGLISDANASIAVTGGASLTASQITIGEDPTASWNVAGQLALNATGGGTIRVRGGAAAQFGSFALNTTGSADVFQQLSLQLSGSSAVGNLILNSGTNIVDNGSSVVVTGNAQFTAPVLSLLNDGDETLTIAGNALFESV
ncbi:MAG: hypothetical protein ACK48Y_12585, partial [Planctomyces sp.]